MRTLALAPSEFWAMEPRHFWWLVETLTPPESAKRLFTEDERQELLDMLHKAKREAGLA